MSEKVSDIDPQVDKPERGPRDAERRTREKLPRQKHGLNKMQKAWVSPPGKKSDVLWAKLFLDDLQGETRKGLSINARRANDAITCHYFGGYQKDNGNLKIPYNGFVASGVSKNLVGKALAELEAAKMISSKPAPVSHLYAGRLYHTHSYGFDPARKRASKRFTHISLDVMRSAAWQGMGINERRIMDRVLVELIKRWPYGNGNLAVSHRQMIAVGVDGKFVRASIGKLVAAGFLEVKRGAARGSQEAPNIYRITFLGTTEGPATWRKPEEAEAVVAPKKPRKKSFKAEALLDAKIYSTLPECTAVTLPDCLAVTLPDCLAVEPISRSLIVQHLIEYASPAAAEAAMAEQAPSTTTATAEPPAIPATPAPSAPPARAIPTPKPLRRGAVVSGRTEASIHPKKLKLAPASTASPAMLYEKDEPAFTLPLSDFAAAPPLPQNFYTIGTMLLVEHSQRAQSPPDPWNAITRRPGWDDRQKAFFAMRRSLGRTKTGKCRYRVKRPTPSLSFKRRDGGSNGQDCRATDFRNSGQARKL